MECCVCVIVSHLSFTHTGLWEGHIFSLSTVHSQGNSCFGISGSIIILFEAEVSQIVKKLQQVSCHLCIIHTFTHKCITTHILLQINTKWTFCLSFFNFVVCYYSSNLSRLSSLRNYFQQVTSRDKVKAWKCQTLCLQILSQSLLAHRQSAIQRHTQIKWFMFYNNLLWWSIERRSHRQWFAMTKHPKVTFAEESQVAPRSLAGWWLLSHYWSPQQWSLNPETRFCVNTFLILLATHA